MSTPEPFLPDGAAHPGGGAAPGGAVDGVLFDVDDTLVDTRGAFSLAIDAVCAVYLPHLPVERYGEVLALWRSDPHGWYRAYTRGELTFDGQRMLRANELQETFGGAVLAEDGYAGWRSVFWGTFEEGWRAHDDAAPVLKRLAAAGVRVGALSNAAVALQTDKLSRSGLSEVPMLVGVDTLGFGKPDPRVFVEACARLGTDPARTVYVGDELDVDARAAAAAGLTGVWIDRPGTRRGGPAEEDPEAARAAGVHVVASLDEVGDLVLDGR
ncbi:HAD family hydrolase [Oerskovia paurometabola]|uniref:HAD family hydrolase n=1 Tax=Oerskovia paurometabola TaxID=162170 RepID=A0ABW1XDN5_9CELL|nr:HAD family hydrolase [Oerskovia paurometabola]MBM7496740.1 putative hydrolase of the HAD superfamily [Oerskovia paurometabola]